MRTEQVARWILLQFVSAPPFSLVLWLGITVTYLGVRLRRLTVYFRSSLTELCENLPLHNGEVNLQLAWIGVCTRSTLGH